MSKAKKFGTFSGVFTPSILTILGVIMYLRFPWIIGQAGLYMTLGIIAVAHIISVSTGLSVASVATDKKVKTGGTYYIISRSLGLPIGGTLGIALFVGLSFSVSLYLIGFAESFLNYWNLEISINTIRITGTAVLILVTILTLISTSLALKSQYFIMAAIALSLVSVFFGTHEFTPETVQLEPIANSAPFMILFGIFFPAVTGFEAGVSMSGDLRNPKKSLPLGAMLAVSVGLIVYIGLAFFYAYTVDYNVLVNDPQVLFSISLVPELVIAGIWGATLSSALGSILGAPRILQATAMDKITPKIFARGYGISNEPRNALLLTFAIAEAGILIGELDVIARIVSMFFITTYAFLNLACFIESWAGSDFRPSFRVPRIVSLIGALACFIVMIQLDFVALIGATVVLGLLFLFLKRKELSLETGDAWGSFWARIIKKGLTNISETTIDIRNWRPNIIMFSGGEKARPYLVELGISMAGRFGMVTDFELIEKQQEKTVGKGVATKSKEKGIFRKQFVCTDVYEGINTITRIYGFSGIEPNTVLMGWAKNIRNTEQFSKLIRSFKEQQLNTVFLKYSQDKQFGNKEKIDIWWRGAGRNLSFSLAIAKFMQSVPGWFDARLRILLINDKTSQTDIIYNNLYQILSDARISAKVEVINNEIEKRSSQAIIQTKSADADLVMLGMSDDVAQKPQHYISYINQLTRLEASMLILNSSSFFAELNAGIEVIKAKPVAPVAVEDEVALPQLPEVTHSSILKKLTETDIRFREIANDFIESTLAEIHSLQKTGWSKYFKAIYKNIEFHEKKYSPTDNDTNLGLLYKNYNRFLYLSKSIFEDSSRKAETIKNRMEAGLSLFKAKTGNYVYSFPKTLSLIYQKNDLHSRKSDSFFRKANMLKRRLSAYMTNQPYSKDIKTTPYLNHYLLNCNNLLLKQLLYEYTLETIKTVSEIRNFMIEANNSFRKLHLKNKCNPADLSRMKSLINRTNQKILADSDALYNTVRQKFLLGVNQNICLLTVDLDMEHKKPANAKIDEDLVGDIMSFAETWQQYFTAVVNTNYIDSLNLSCLYIFTKQQEKVIEEIGQFVKTEILDAIQQEIDIYQKTDFNRGENEEHVLSKIRFTERDGFLTRFNELQDKFNDFITELPEKIDAVRFDESTIGDIAGIENFDVITIPYRRIVKYKLETKHVDNIFRVVGETEKSLATSLNKIKEKTSITNFNLTNLDEEIDTETEIKKAGQKIINQVLAFITNEKEIIESLPGKLRQAANESLKNTFDELNVFNIINSADELGSLIRGQKSKKALNRFGLMTESVKNSVNNQIVRILYGKSEGLLIAHKYLEIDDKKVVSTEKIVALIEKMSPDNRVLNQLPLYYRNLFSGKSAISSDFLRNKSSLQLKVEKAISTHNSARKGAILITGEPGSGKTELSKYVARQFKHHNIFLIKPLIGGSPFIDDFNDALSEATGKLGKTESILQSLDSDSVLIIDNLELWWLRTNTGYEVLEYIISCISKFGSKSRFIVSCNSYSLNFINRIIPLNNSFIAVIDCEPYTSHELKELIMLRHNSTGLVLNYKGSYGDNISQWQKARLFNACFDFSEGNPGIALNTWLSNIIKVENNTLTVRSPEIPDYEPLCNLDSKILVYLVQFILHKQLTIRNAEKIFNENETDILKMFDSLQTALLITKDSKDIYTVNQYVQPFLIKALVAKKLI